MSAIGFQTVQDHDDSTNCGGACETCDPDWWIVLVREEADARCLQFEHTLHPMDAADMGLT